MLQPRSSAGRRYTKRAKEFTLPSTLFPAGKAVLTTASTLSARCPGSRRHTAWWSMSEAKRTNPRQWEIALEWLDRADGDLRIAESCCRKRLIYRGAPHSTVSRRLKK